MLEPSAVSVSADGLSQLTLTPLSLARRLMPLAILLIALLGVPALWSMGAIGVTPVNQLGRFSCFAIVALGIDIIWGYAGILSLCQAMFFCIGGYAMGMYLALHGPLDGNGIPRCLFVVTSEVSGFNLPWFWHPFHGLAMSLLLGLVVPGAVGFSFGYLAFRSRVRGVYFSIITQALTVMAWLVFCRNEVHLCGTNGLTNFVTISGFDLRSEKVKVALYMTSVAALGLSYFMCRWLVGSRAGRILLAVRDNESRLRFAGFDPAAYKTFAFALAAVLAGLGGLLYVPQNGIITPAKMVSTESITMVVWVAVGGRGTLSGAILGAVVVSLLSSYLTTSWPSVWPFLLGGLSILLVLFCPQGLIGLWQKWQSMRSKPVVPEDVILRTEGVE